MSDAAPLRRRASVVCIADRQILVVKLRDPVTGLSHWFIPGGMIEAGETPVEAAARETLEETGYLVRVLPETRLLSHYLYTWGGRDFSCETHFFRAELLASRHAPQAIHDADYHQGAAWLPLAQAEECLGFHAEIWKAVQSLINLSSSSLRDF